MKVDTLMKYYENLDTLAVDSAKATAANQTAANLESAQLGMDARRLDQEKQLEHFRQQMENLRNARATGSSEKIAFADINARKQAAILSQTFEGSENAKKMAMEKELAEMSEAGAQQRLNQQLESNTIDTNARINAERDLAGMKNEFERPLQEAQIAESRVKTEVLGRYDFDAANQSLAAIYDMKSKGAPSSVVKELTEIKLKEIRNAGVDPNILPAYAAQRAPEIKAKRAELLKSSKTDGINWVKKAAAETILNDIYELEQLISQNAIRDPKAGWAMIEAKKKRLGVTDKDIEDIL